jgi:hypothetical protein
MITNDVTATKTSVHTGVNSQLFPRVNRSKSSHLPGSSRSCGFPLLLRYSVLESHVSKQQNISERKLQRKSYVYRGV